MRSRSSSRPPTGAAFLLGVAALLSACTKNVLEPVPDFPSCAFNLELFRKAMVNGSLEAGRIEGDVFTPLASGDAIEIAPWPGADDVPGTWFATLAFRIPAPPTDAATPCLQVSGSPINYTLHPAAGIPMRRLVNGDLVADAVPVKVGIRNTDFDHFFSLLGTPRSFTFSALLAGTEAIIDARATPLDLVLVNEEGFLSAPKAAPPDAGSPPVHQPPSYSAFLTIRQPNLHPGESSPVELAIVGPRSGERVDFVKQFVPGTLLVLDRNEIDGSVPDEAARVTRGTLGIDANATPGEYELLVTVTAASGYAAEARYTFTIAAP